MLLWRRYTDSPARALAAHVAKMRATIDNTPHPVFVRDIEGRLVACNASFQNFLSMDLSQLRGKKITDLKHMSRSMRSSITRSICR